MAEDLVQRLKQAKSAILQEMAQEMAQLLEEKWRIVNPALIQKVFAEAYRAGPGTVNSYGDMTSDRLQSGMTGNYDVTPVENVQITGESVIISTSDPILVAIHNRYGGYALTEADIKNIETRLKGIVSRLL